MKRDSDMTSKPANPNDMSGLDQLYQEIIVEHYKEPRNFEKLPEFDFESEGYHPMCGARVNVQVKLGSDSKLERVCFQGEGCSICLASASMMTEEVEEKPLLEVFQKIKDFRALMQGENPPDLDGDIESLKGVRRFPVRIKCALLAWTTLKGALESKSESKGEKS